MSGRPESNEGAGGIPLRVVDGRRLGKEMRDVLRPGGVLPDELGFARRLPRFFYEVPSWDAALTLQLSPHFALWEFIHTDVREAPPLRTFPRYVPCAVTLLAQCLERFREAAGSFVHIAANGGYRSPGHALNRRASPHAWAAAANIHKIGDTMLDTREAIERYAAVARETIRGVWVRPYGRRAGDSDDHLHLDLGYVVVVPHGAPGDPYEASVEHEAP